MARFKTAQHGFSLVEILLVLGVIASLMVGAFLIYPKVKNSQNVNEAVDKIALVASAHRQFFNGKTIPANLARADAIAAGIVTEQDMNTPWGTITYSSVNSRLALQLNNVPRDVCGALGQRLDSMADLIMINNAGTKTTPAPVTLENVAYGCGLRAGDATIQVQPTLMR
jgi:prepilin-type N-terminal cleavage/methylation domain-containing protein